MSGSLIFGLDLVFISFKKARADSYLYLSRSRSVPDSMYVRKLSLVRPPDSPRAEAGPSLAVPEALGARERPDSDDAQLHLEPRVPRSSPRWRLLNALVVPSPLSAPPLRCHRAVVPAPASSSPLLLQLPLRVAPVCGAWVKEGAERALHLIGS